jgi:hypothetical protein
MTINILTNIPNFQGAGRRRGRLLLRLLKNFRRGESARLKAKDFQVPLKIVG